MIDFYWRDESRRKHFKYRKHSIDNISKLGGSYEQIKIVACNAKCIDEFIISIFSCSNFFKCSVKNNILEKLFYLTWSLQFGIYHKSLGKYGHISIQRHNQPCMHPIDWKYFLFVNILSWFDDRMEKQLLRLQCMVYQNILDYKDFYICGQKDGFFHMGWNKRPMLHFWSMRFPMYACIVDGIFWPKNCMHHILCPRGIFSDIHD